MGRFNLVFPYLLFCLLAGLVAWSNIGRESSPRMTYEESMETMAALQENVITGRVAPEQHICQNCGLSIADQSQLAVDDQGSMIRFCSQDCRELYVEMRLMTLSDKKTNSLIDPVCHMEVNPSWGIQFEFEGVVFHFCCDMCRQAFAADPLAYIAERCMVCAKPVIPATAFPATYLGDTYYLCSEEHRQEFKTDSAQFFMHRMWGIPTWLYYVSIALVLVVSFFMFEGAALLRKKRGKEDGRIGRRASDRIDLLQFSVVRQALLSRLFRFFLQVILVGLFLVIIAAGLFGNQNPALNVAPLLTWTIWWCGLIVLIMFAGKVWCYMCPWDAIAFWVEKLCFWRKKSNGLGLGLPWPKRFRNIFLATFLFVLLTWFELGFNVTMRPAFTAYIGIGMLVMAIGSAFIFERKSFCRYGCLVGRVSGLYALFSGIEVRKKDGSVCEACEGKECYRGSETSYGCPTFEFPATMKENTYCIQCAECLQGCPHDNLAVNVRPWGEDLKQIAKPRTDEAYLALLMLAISGFHGLTMTPVWAELTSAIESLLPIGRMGSFSFGMVIILGLPVVIYGVLVWCSQLLSGAGTKGTSGLSYKDYFVRYAYCLLPIALFYHLAHNAEHLLMEGPKIFARISDPFGWGWNLFSTAGWYVPPLTSLDVLWIAQIILVGTGHIYSLWVAQRITKDLFHNNGNAVRGQWPMLAAMIIFSVFSLWLLKQPMEMRTSAM